MKHFFGVEPEFSPAHVSNRLKTTVLCVIIDIIRNLYQINADKITIKETRMSFAYQLC